MEIIRHAVTALMETLTAEDAIPLAIRRLHFALGRSEQAFTAAQVLTLNASQDLLDRKLNLRYPLVMIYCDRLRRSATPRFCRFAGALRLGIDIRVSSDRIENLEPELQSYVDVILAFLLERQGNWTDDAFFDGEYEVQFGPVKPGGKHYVQSARILFECALTVH